jgi:hypothetical protein
MTRARAGPRDCARGRHIALGGIPLVTSLVASSDVVGRVVRRPASQNQATRQGFGFGLGRVRVKSAAYRPGSGSGSGSASKLRRTSGSGPGSGLSQRAYPRRNRASSWRSTATATTSRSRRCCCSPSGSSSTCEQGARSWENSRLMCTEHTRLMREGRLQPGRPGAPRARPAP